MISAEMEAAQEQWKNRWLPTHTAVRIVLVDSPHRVDPISAIDCPDNPEAMEVIREVQQQQAGPEYEKACRTYGRDWWDRVLARCSLYPLAYGLVARAK